VGVVPYRRRLLGLLVVAAVVGLPAGILRAACVGNSCDERAATNVRLPFCSLPDRVRQPIADGFRDGRSPDVLGVATSEGLRGTLDPDGGARAGSGKTPAARWTPWPSTGDPDLRVPIAFWGAGIRAGAPLPDGVGLRDVAPTLEGVLGIRRPHPGVRSGRAIDGVTTGEVPSLVLVVGLKLVGTADLEADPQAWPNLGRLLDEGAGTLLGSAGSLPLDPAATLTTLGTGALPSEHGITGRSVRGDDGRVTRAWSRGAPLTIVAALGDDLDMLRDQRPRVGVVLEEPTDRGLIGGTWYVDADRDDVIRAATDRAPGAVARLLDDGYGADDVPDLLGVTLSGRVGRIDRALGAILRRAVAATDGGVAVVVAGTGTPGAEAEPSATGTPGGPDGGSVLALVDGIEGTLGAGGVVAAAAAGGLFLDQDVLAEAGITNDRVVRAMLAARRPDGSRILADAFPGFAVSFARYC
jgi:hypothetical protein